MAVRRTAALVAIWRALRASRRPGEPGLRERMAAVPRFAVDTLTGRYPGATRGRLLLLLAAVAYLLSPFDLVPEALLAVLGLADDALVITWLAGALLADTDAYLEWRRGPGRVVPGQVLDEQRP